MFLLGVLASAFFSGTETAFYRAGRVKLVIRALEKERISRFLVWLSNHPAFLIGTILIGNNIANYLVSFAIVTFVSIWFVDGGASTEMAATLLLTPVLFVFGESLPKSACHQAPNRLLHAAGIPLAFFTLLLAPLSAILWSLSRFLERIVGQSPERLRLALARTEVKALLDEGQEVGVLHPSQRQLSHNFFLVAGKQVKQVCTPVNRVPAIKSNSDLASAIRLAQRYSMPDIPVYGTSRSELIGYVHLVDLLVLQGATKAIPKPKPFVEINGNEPFAEALLQMQTQRETLSLIVDGKGQKIGLLSIDQLTQQLLRGPLESLRR
jgi:CBS domain containing-hemolysin-like protein